MFQFSTYVLPCFTPNYVQNGCGAIDKIRRACPRGRQNIDSRSTPKVYINYEMSYQEYRVVLSSTMTISKSKPFEALDNATSWIAGSLLDERMVQIAHVDLVQLHFPPLLDLSERRN